MRVLISGAGIAGLTLAWCLERKGHRPLVVERAPDLRGDGYMLDFFGSGYDAALRMGFIPDLERIHHAIAKLTFVDESGHERLSLPYPVLRKRLFADHHFNLMRGDLERMLFEKIANYVEVRFGMTVDAFESTKAGVRARLSDGSTHDVDLLVGADGVHSHIRRLAFGEEQQFTRFVGCYTAAFVVAQGAHRLGISDEFVTLTVPGRQVAVYPVRGGRLAAFFVDRAERKVDDFSHESAIRELRAAYGQMRWVVPELIEQAATSSNLYFDAVSQIEMQSWSKGRIVLIGDACQCLSLLAGQGASMAVAGAYILAEELEGEGGRYIAGALSRYERRLKPCIEQKQAAGRNIATWFVPTNGLRLALRDLGMRMSVWPVASSIIRRRMAADSVFAA